MNYVKSLLFGLAVFSCYCEANYSILIRARSLSKDSLVGGIAIYNYVASEPGFLGVDTHKLEIAKGDFKFDDEFFDVVKAGHKEEGLFTFAKHKVSDTLSITETERLPVWKNTRTYKFNLVDSATNISVRLNVSISFSSEDDYKDLDIIDIMLVPSDSRVLKCAQTFKHWIQKI